MSRRGKLAVTLASTLVLLLVAALIVAGSRMSDIARGLLLDIGPRATGTDWSLADLDIVLLAGHGSLDDLIIGNPPSHDADHAMHFEHAAFDVALGSLLGEVLVIEEVSIDGAELVYEQHGLARSNLQTIVDNIRAYGGAGSAGEAGEGETARAFAIRRLSFTHGRVLVRSELFGERSVEVPAVIVTDIGGRTGREALANALERILTPIVAEAIAAARAAAIDAGKQKLRDKVGEALEGLLEDRDQRPEPTE